MQNAHNEQLSLWGYFTRAITNTKFSGRARRKEYWGFFLFHTPVFVICQFLSIIFQFSEVAVSILFAVNIFWISLGVAVSVRRLHDIDRSGWWYLLVLLPVLGTLVLLVFFCIEGTKGDNRFGADPKQF